MHPHIQHTHQHLKGPIQLIPPFIINIPKTYLSFPYFNPLMERLDYDRFGIGLGDIQNLIIF